MSLFCLILNLLSPVRLKSRIKSLLVMTRLINRLMKSLRQAK